MTGYRILVAEDDPIARSSLADYLVLSGYEVSVAADGREAVEKARRLRPDAVLLDVQMPGSDGLEVLRILRDDPDLMDTPILLVTSLARTNVKVRALDLGADDYIVKPFDKVELVARVRRALRRSARYRELSGKLEGNLADVALPELLQTLELGKKTARVSFVGPGAELFLERGFLRAATWAGSPAEEALCRLLLVNTGSFRVTFEDPSPLGESPAGLPVQEALLEAARALDELRRVIPGSPSWESLFEIAGGEEALAGLRLPGQSGPLSLGTLATRFDGSLPEAVRTLAAAIQSGAVRAIPTQD